MAEIGLGLTFLSLIIWIGLLGFRGQFWRTDQRLVEAETEPQPTPSVLYPSVCAVVPARNEAALLPVTLRSLLSQDYPGSYSVILVDDGSTDGTASVAQQVAQELKTSSQLEIIPGVPLPAGWTGKLWAMEQGIRHAQNLTSAPDYLLFTDADIEHNRGNLRRLVAKAQQDDLDLVSLMVLLRCQDFWEQFLIPAFVFFFQKLYPFNWVNDPSNPTAAAAGGCILIRREALNRIGGIQVVRQALIDDCALAQAVKSSGFSEKAESRSRIWLGLTSLTRSLRPYPSLETIWEMVARTAYTQLNYSPWLLLGTLCAMTLIYLVSPVGAIWGGLTGNWLVAIAGLSGWLLMAGAYLPILRFYGCSPWFAFSLPAIAFLYTLMTLDSAIRHWQGRGGAWKGRVYDS
ncbi:glycosyltransferase [Allocoleopsis sp.]|uniref:glycosyltransferase n=1 Tax=Allocoleopsis sp. TaxID=3088169 RepID=UPI0032C217E5